MWPGSDGIGQLLHIAVVNNTGSDVLTHFNTDLPHFGDMINFGGRLLSVRVVDALGNIQVLPHLLVEVQVVNEDHVP